MGSCLSKKNACASSLNPVQLPEKIETKKTEEENHVKKEIIIIKQRKSHELELASPAHSTDNVLNVTGGGVIRTSSCTKEELDAILIQCGRLSRSSSIGRKYSGSKRSFDNDDITKIDVVEDAVFKSKTKERENQRSQRTPSRERSGNSARRVSRSPGRRSESPINTNSRVSRSPGRRSESPINTNSNHMPGKMISVPPTVTSLDLVKDHKTSTNNVKMIIQVKKNVGGSDLNRTGASPRARSPVRIRSSNENRNSNSGLSRSNSRKANNSPYRRNPLSEIDTNIISQSPNQKQNPKNRTLSVAEKKPNNTKIGSNMINSNNKKEETKIAVNVISPGPENFNAHPVTRTRSSRLSGDLDINPETLSNPNSSSYTCLLLEDIQNFHQKNTNAPPPSFSLPPCVTKACSILEAVADLNSRTGSNLSEEQRRNIIINGQLNKSNEETTAYVESEVVVGHEDDLMEPSFHKYVTVTRGMIKGAEMEEQESSGSNSFVSNQQIMGSSSCWEPNSADSTGRRTSNSSFLKPVSINNESRISRGRNRTGSKGPVNSST